MGPIVSVRFRGFRLRVHLFTFVIFVTVVAGVSSEYSHTSASRVSVSAISGLVIVLALIGHELLRAQVYRRLGVPVRGLDLFLAGASPRLADHTNSPRSEVVAGLIGLLYIGPLAAIVLLIQRIVSPGDVLFPYLTVLGFSLLGFAGVQTLPALPFDGGRLFRAFIWHLADDPVRGSRGAAVYGHFISAALIGVGAVLLVQPRAWPYWGLAMVVTGLQIAAVSAAEVRDAFCQQHGRALPLDSMVIAWSRRIPATESISVAVEALIAEHDGPPLLVVSESATPIGMLSQHHLKGTRRSEWPSRTIGEVMRPLSDLPIVSLETNVFDAMLLLEESQKDFGVVQDRSGHVRFICRETLETQLYAMHAPKRDG